jgi:enterochelin esterase-like enzyme
MSRTVRAGIPLLAAAMVAVAHVAVPASAQDAAGLRKGRLERVRVHGPSLEGNLSGDSPERDVTVYLPPGYDEDANRRYPVLYMLHGYTDSDERWMGLRQSWISLSAVLDSTFADGGVRELIVVMPNSYTRFQGSMYANSITTGYWEDFITRDLVAWTDARYRTIADRAARGLAGHSMGGYGALRIGMKHPDVYAAVYALSPCCMSARTAAPEAVTAMANAEQITTLEQFAAAPFGTRALIASAAAWAPNPGNPPFFLDLPTRNGEPRHDVIAKLAANAPLAMVDQYIPNLKRLRGFGIDSGDRDRGIAPTVQQLHEVLDRYGVEHVFAIYPGDHLSGVADRIRTVMMPFFTRHLSADPLRD